jgi:hypothetical protein
MRSNRIARISRFESYIPALALAAAAFVTIPASAKAQTVDQVKAHCQSPSMRGAIYTNKEYGFRVDLPASWKGYRIEVTEWHGARDTCDQKKAPTPQKGPIVSIVHPLSTKENPWQDIPIMVFTLAQWKMVHDETIYVSAAPYGPGELARNAKYVFALPPRFDNSDADGSEEVGEIAQCDFLSAL